MTTSILKAYSRRTYSTLSFYSRVIQRIGPVLLISVLGTLVAGLIFYPELNWPRLINESIASLLQFQNIYLMTVSADYFARDAFTSPFQQLWFLSTFFQFAALLPIIILSGLALSRKWGTYLPLVAILTTLAMASFFYTLSIINIHPEATYFDPLARAWQFLAGSLAAVIAGSLSLPPRFANFLGWAALGLFLLAAYLMPMDALFPGWLALLPVSACIGVIISGLTLSETYFYRLMSSPYLTHLGKDSLLIYLIHWPIIVFTLFLAGEKTPSFLTGFTIIIASVCLARLANILISKLQHSYMWANAYVSVGACLAFAITSSSAAVYYNGKLEQLKHDPYTASIAGSKVQALTGEFAEEKRPSSAAIMRAAYHRYGGRQEKTSCMPHARAGLIPCTYGDKSASRIIVLVGGSHSHQWLPAFDVVARVNKLRLVTFFANGCPYGYFTEGRDYCKNWYSEVLKEIESIRPELVISTSTTTKDAQRVEFVPEGFIKFWQELERLEISFLGVRDNPRFSKHIPQCIASSNKFIEACSGQRADKLAETNPSLMFEGKTGRRYFVDMTDYFCNETNCPPIANGHIVYSDQDHLTVDYSLALADVLANELIKAVPAIFSATCKDVGAACASAVSGHDSEKITQ